VQDANAMPAVEAVVEGAASAGVDAVIA